MPDMRKAQNKKKSITTIALTTDNNNSNIASYSAVIASKMAS